jgi:2-polyprenyl-3-methyl-5-hydroxy-6-metoxy-1,4-benzoquinol methylase
MLEKIQACKSEVIFDIQRFAAPHDTESYLLADFVDHYHTLHATLCAITPKRVIDCNASFGYSTATILDACPDALLTCIFTAESSEKDVEWLQHLLARKGSRLLSDQELPKNEMFDLVIVSGKGDGDSLSLTLERYAEKGIWLVISGGMATTDDMTAMSHWLRKYRVLIDYSLILPTRSGVVLVKMRQQPKKAVIGSSEIYKELEASYTSEYYLTDCGGYTTFRQTGGQELVEPRLVGICKLADPQPGKRILDVGCGRGELAFALAQSGATVTAIDYSAEAISLALTTYGKQQVCMNGLLTFVQKDLMDCVFEQAFDVIVAADFIEHVDGAVADKMIERLQAMLNPDGICIMHTSPNLLNYIYTYGFRRKMAKNAGSYLPPNPRTYYEEQMHINEQSPAKLNRLMKRHFRKVFTWVSSMPDIIGTLKSGQSRNELIQGTSIFSVASNRLMTREEVLNRIDNNSSNRQNKQSDYSRQEWACYDSNMSRLQTLIEEARSNADAGAEVTPMLRFNGLSRMIALYAGKIIIYLASFITGKQRVFNARISEAVYLLAELVEKKIKPDGSESSGPMKHNPIMNAGLNTHFQSFTSNTAVANKNQLDAFYLAFEDRFRGTRDEIKNRFEVYVPYIRAVGAGVDAAPVLDLGCGRGEWLELLRDSGLVGRGVDLNGIMVSLCKGKGLSAKEEDAFSSLSLLQDNSLGAITAFHVVEHLLFLDLLRLFTEAYRVLQPGGVAIFETPNPENVFVGSCSFYLDPTHNRPIPPQTLQFIAEQHPFRKIEILRVNKDANVAASDNTENNSMLENRLICEMDYSVICYK